MAVMLPMFLIMNQIDFKNPDNIQIVRVAYVSLHVLAFVICGLLYKLISDKKDARKIAVPKAQQGFGASGEPEMEQKTIQQYDLAQLQKLFSQLGIGVLVVLGIHYKWEIIQPLFLQCGMIPMTIWKSPLFKIYLMGQTGEVEQRPFAEDSNPIAALMGGGQQAPQPQQIPQEPAVDQEPAEDNTNNEEEEEVKEQPQQGKSKKKGKKKN